MTTRCEDPVGAAEHRASPRRSQAPERWVSVTTSTARSPRGCRLGDPVQPGAVLDQPDSEISSRPWALIMDVAGAYMPPLGGWSLSPPSSS